MRAVITEVHDSDAYHKVSSLKGAVVELDERDLIDWGKGWVGCNKVRLVADGFDTAVHMVRIEEV